MNQEQKTAASAFNYIKQAGLANVAKQVLAEAPQGFLGGSVLGLKAMPSAAKGFVTGGVSGMGKSFVKNVENTINSENPIYRYIGNMAEPNGRPVNPIRAIAASTGIGATPAAAATIGGTYVGDRVFGHSYRNRINKMETDAGIAKTVAKQQQAVIAALQAKLNAIREANAVANQVNKAGPVAQLPDPYAEKPKTK